MAHELEPWKIQQMIDIAFITSKEVVNTKHFMTIGQKPFTKMGANKPGSTSDETT